MAHLELLVEEPSMEAFLRTLLPRLLAPGFTFEVHVFQGKRDLLSKLSARLRGYQRWLPPDYRLVVLVDQDDNDCRVLKKRLEHAATTAGLASRTQVGNQTWKVATRVVRGVGSVVLRRLGGGMHRLSASIKEHSEEGRLSRPRRDPRRDLGSVRTNLEAGRLFQDRITEGGSSTRDCEIH